MIVATAAALRGERAQMQTCGALYTLPARQWTTVIYANNTQDVLPLNPFCLALFARPLFLLLLVLVRPSLTYLAGITGIGKIRDALQDRCQPGKQRGYEYAITIPRVPSNSFEYGGRQFGC